MKALLSLFLFINVSFISYATNISTISQQQLLSLLNAPLAPDFMVLDVRSDDEFKAGHVQGAINISHGQIEQHLSKLTHFKNKIVIVYCRSGRRAKTAEAVLQANGFTLLRHLNGDYNAWLAADLPLIKE